MNMHAFYKRSQYRYRGTWHDVNISRPKTLPSCLKFIQILFEVIKFIQTLVRSFPVLLFSAHRLFPVF